MVNLFSYEKQNINQQGYQGPFMPATAPVAKTEQPVMIFAASPQSAPKAEEINVFAKTQTAKVIKQANNKDSGIYDEVPGYFIAKDTKARTEFAQDQYKKLSPEQQKAKFGKLEAGLNSKEDAEIVAGSVGAMDTKIQVDADKKLLNNTTVDSEVKTHLDNQVAINVKTLADENQLPVTEEVFNKTQKETKILMATEIPYLAKQNQVGGTKLVIATNDSDVIKAGASQASKLAKENQTESVRLYQQTKLTAEEQKLIDKAIISQYGQFAKENEVDIHKIMSSSKYSETAELAASNINKLDKANQAAALEVTNQTKNEAATKAAQASLEKAEAEAKVKTIKSAEAEAKKSTEEKINEIKTIISDKKASTSSLEKSIKKLSSAEQISLLKQCPNNSSIINILLQNNPSLSVLNEINLILKDNNELVDSKKLMPQMGFLSASLQSSIVRDSAAKKELGFISRAQLNINVKAEYDALVKKQEQKEKQGFIFA